MRKVIYEESDIFSIFLSFVLISIVFFLFLLLFESKLIQFLFEFKPINFVDAVFGYSLYTVVFGGYVMTYPAISAETPTFQILQLLEKQGPLHKQEIICLLDKNEIINTKVERLQLDGFISIENGCFKLTKTGAILIIPFILYRKILGLGVGAG